MNVAKIETNRKSLDFSIALFSLFSIALSAAFGWGSDAACIAQRAAAGIIFAIMQSTNVFTNQPFCNFYFYLVILITVRLVLQSCNKQMYLQTNLFVESNDCKKADRQRVFDVSGKARISLRILFERNLDLFGRAFVFV